MAILEIDGETLMAKQQGMGDRVLGRLTGAGFLALSLLGTGGCGAEFDACREAGNCPAGASSEPNGATGVFDSDSGAVKAGTGSAPADGTIGADASAAVRDPGSAVRESREKAPNGARPASCTPGVRDCTSRNDNDCDGEPDSAKDATCACAVGEVRGCTLTDPNTQNCRPGIAQCALGPSNSTSFWGTCRARLQSDPAPTYVLDRLWDPEGCFLGSACTKTRNAAGVGTLQSKCATYSSTCGYLYCI